MQGKQITAYVGAEYQPEFKRPVGAEKILKSWEPTQQLAQQRKREMEQRYPNAIIQISG